MGSSEMLMRVLLFAEGMRGVGMSEGTWISMSSKEDTPLLLWGGETHFSSTFWCIYLYTSGFHMGGGGGGPGILPLPLPGFLIKIIYEKGISRGTE